MRLLIALLIVLAIMLATAWVPVMLEEKKPPVVTDYAIQRAIETIDRNDLHEDTKQHLMKMKKEN